MISPMCTHSDVFITTGFINKTPQAAMYVKFCRQNKSDAAV